MPRVKAMDNVLNMWHCRGLSLKGKVTILKSLALPKLQYVASVLPVPHAVVQLVDNMIIDFIWGKKKPKIKKDVIIQNIEDGGLKVPHFGDIVKTCKITWIKRILTSDNAKWKTIFENLIAPMSILHFTETYLNDDLIKTIPLPFYEQIYMFWNEIKAKPEMINNYQQQILWHNKFIVVPSGIKVKQKKTPTRCIFWKEFYKAGVIKIKDLLDGNGNVLSHNKFCLR